MLSVEPRVVLFLPSRINVVMSCRDDTRTWTMAAECRGRRRADWSAGSSPPHPPPASVASGYPAVNSASGPPLEATTELSSSLPIASRACTPENSTGNRRAYAIPSIEPPTTSTRPATRPSPRPPSPSAASGMSRLPGHAHRQRIRA